MDMDGWYLLNVSGSPSVYKFLSVHSARTLVALQYCTLGHLDDTGYFPGIDSFRCDSYSSVFVVGESIRQALGDAQPGSAAI